MERQLQPVEREKDSSEMFRKDEEALLKQGIQEEDIPLMLDLL